MSVLISTGNINNGDGFILASSTEKTEEQLKISGETELIFNSNHLQTLEVVAIDEFPFTNAYRTTNHTGFDSGYMEASIVANIHSTGIYADLFNYEKNYFDSKYATVYYVYNTAINKALLFSDGLKTEIQNNIPFTQCLGTALKFYTRWLDPYNPSLYEVGIASDRNNTIGMEFINNSTSNVLVRIKLSITIDSTNGGFRLSVPTYSTDIELSTKTCKINGIETKDKKYIGYITSFLTSTYVPNFGSLDIPVNYTTYSGFSNPNNYPGIFINGQIPYSINPFIPTECLLESTSLTYTNSLGYKIPIFGSGISPHYKKVSILDTSNMSNTLTLLNTESNLVILAYSTQVVFNGSYIGIINMPYFFTSKTVAHLLVNIPSPGTARLNVNRSGSVLSLSQVTTGMFVNTWGWTVKLWVFEFY